MIRIILVLQLLFVFACRISASEYAYDETKGVTFAWTNADMVGAYTISGTRIRLDVEGLSNNPHDVTFTGKGWSMVENSLYYCYSPYTSDFVINGNHMTALPIKYTGQTQKGNNDLSHLAAYDYMTSQAMSTDWSIDFNYIHLGCILRMSCYMPKQTVVKELLISSDDDSEDVFVTDAVMNVTNNVLTPVKKSGELSLLFDNTTVEEGDSLVAYVMLAPRDYTGRLLKIQIVDEMNDTTLLKVMGTNLQQGRCYPVGMDQQWGRMLESQNAKGFNQPYKITAIQYPSGHAVDFPIDTENMLSVYILYGDANNDGEITREDADMIVNYHLGVIDETANSKAADVNKDGEITIADANMVLNKILNE